MKMFFNLFSDTWVSAFGWMLVHSLWQGAILVLTASLGLYLLRKSPAAARYTLGTVMLCLQVVLSVTTFFYYYLTTASGTLSNAVKTTAGAVSDWKATTYELSLTAKMQLWLGTHIQELVICWLIGALVLVLRFLGGWLYTEHLRHNAKAIINKEWRARFGILTAKLKVYQSIELKESAKIRTPMVIGTLQPVILIPLGLLTGFPPSQIEAILAHELAHIRRHDYLVNMLQSFIEVVFFFHPALWWLSERVRVEREHCCDDLAIEACGDRMSLAHALVGMAEWNSSHTLAMAFASKKPLLLQRVKRVLGITPKPAGMFGNLPVTLFFVVALIGISLYAVGQDKVKKKKSQTHQTSGKHNKVASVRTRAHNPTAEPEAFIAIPDIDEPVIPDVDYEIDESALAFMNDTLRNKMDAYRQKMEVLQKEIEPLQRRMEELHLEMEKQQFEVEHFERDEEKLEWKKDRANEARENLIEKRSSLLHADHKTAKLKLNEADLEKQLADFEQQIKAQEQTITQLNATLADSRKAAEKAEEPFKKVEKEMEEISRKMEELGNRMEMESREIGKFMPAPPPPPRAPRAMRARSTPKATAATPAPKVPKAPPAPPVPPVKN